MLSFSGFSRLGHFTSGDPFTNRTGALCPKGPWPRMFTRTLSGIMPKPLNVDWPAVRVLAVVVGVREAARQTGISEDAVRQRSKRERWMTSPKAMAQRALAKPVTKVSPDALSPADALVNVLSERKHRTKLGLSKHIPRKLPNRRRSIETSWGSPAMCGMWLRWKCLKMVATD